MVGGGTATFTDPGDYCARVTGASINLVLSGGGEFQGHLTWIDLPRLRLVRGRENVPRIAFVTAAPGTVLVAFPTNRNPPQNWGGVTLGPRDIVLLGPGERIHQRTSGASQWGFISLAPEVLADCSRILTGTDMVAQSALRILRPPSGAAAHFSRLHAEAGRLAEAKPKLIARREVVRAMEHDLLHALVNCVTAADTHEHPLRTAAMRRHASIMTKLEAILARHHDRQLSTRELCTAVGVGERTLEAYCTEFLGMSPGSYVRLRRLNLVSEALRRADSTTSSISELARRYGFSELGRFAVAYRTVFGETPSTTLRRARQKVGDAGDSEYA
jgi:AraC-like DNA-binding protein